jgi:hypothetical protein
MKAKIIPFIVTVLAAVGCTYQANKSKAGAAATGDNTQWTVPGEVINGVQSVFKIEYGRNGSLKGAVTLKNPGNEPRSLRYYEALYLHVQLKDHSGTPVFLNEHLPIFQPFVRTVILSPNEDATIPINIFLPSVFQMRTGKYRVGFVYDTRLLTNKSPRKFDLQPIVQWSSHDLPVFFDEKAFGP